MDQVKQLLSVAGKHQFWIITGVCLLLGAGGWYLAGTNLDSLFNAQRGKINTAFEDVNKVRLAIPTHPNSNSQEKLDEIIASLREDVRRSWEMQYERQRKFLIWPEEIKQTSMVLVSRLEGYRPVELKLEYPAEPPNITKQMKETYARYFDDQMPKLAKIVGVDWQGEAAAAAAGGMGMGMGMGMGAGMGAGYGGEGMGAGYGGEGGGYGGEGGEGMYSGGGGGMGMGMGMGGGAPKKLSTDLVKWPVSSQSELLSSMRMWTGKTPNVYQILYTQENMWILEGLLRIIAATNGDAKANFQCIIKEIEFIRFGKSAVGKAGTITGASSGMGMGSSMSGYEGDADNGYMGTYTEEGYGEDMYGGQMGYGGEEGGGYGGEGPSTPDPANGRYVDANFAPVSGEDLRTKMKEGEPEDAYFAVAKRVPVRMRFKIDQRRVQEFLAKCGSADLVLEVRQVRLGDTDAAGAPGAAGGMYSGGMGMGLGSGIDGGYGGEGAGAGYGGEGAGYGGEGGEGGMYGGLGGGLGGGGATTAGRADFDIPIEIYGIVYLFNPVDIQKLGLENITADTEYSDTVETPADVESDTPPAGQPAGEEGQPTDGQDEATEGGEAASADTENTDTADSEATAPAAGG